MATEYKIIGGDGAEYGPASLDELRTWIRDGRVARMTQVWRSDTAAWVPAAHYSELGDELGRLHATVVRPCGFWVRLGAYLVDAVVLAAIFQLIWTPLARARNWPLPVWPGELTDAAWKQFLQQWQEFAHRAAPFLYPLFFLYSVLFNGRFGATLGKMAVGVRIVLTDDSPLGYQRAALRWLAARLSDLFFGAGYLLIAIRPDKRALHDLLAGTKVVYRR